MSSPRTALTLAQSSEQPSADGKVSLTIANELSVPVQLRYYWKASDQSFSVFGGLVQTTFKF